MMIDIKLFNTKKDLAVAQANLGFHKEVTGEDMDDPSNIPSGPGKLEMCLNQLPPVNPVNPTNTVNQLICETDLRCLPLII